MFSTEPTPFDLQFQLGRIPVRVHPGFWIVGALGGWHPDDLGLTLIWIMCLFVSILIHELGHALTSEAFGWPSEILLYHFGGLAFSQRYSRETPWKSIAVSLAGPFAGFTLYAIIRLGVHFSPLSPLDWDFYAQFALVQLIYVNLWWGIVNLAPVLPLDGGQVLRSFLEWLRLRNYAVHALRVGVLVGGLMALYFLMRGNRFAGTLFLFLTINNVTALRQDSGRW